MTGWMGAGDIRPNKARHDEDLWQLQSKSVVASHSFPCRCSCSIPHSARYCNEPGSLSAAHVDWDPHHSLALPLCFAFHTSPVHTLSHIQTYSSPVQPTPLPNNSTTSSPIPFPPAPLSTISAFARTHARAHAGTVLSFPSYIPPSYLPKQSLSKHTSGQAAVGGSRKVATLERKLHPRQQRAPGTHHLPSPILGLSTTLRRAPAVFTYLPCLPTTTTNYHHHHHHHHHSTISTTTATIAFTP